MYMIHIYFFFNDTATTEIYTLSLHDALPIYGALERVLHAGEDVEREGRREEALDRATRLAAVRGEGPERFVTRVEHVVHPHEPLETAHPHRGADVRHPVGRQGPVRVRLVAAQELGTDVARVGRDPEPRPGTVHEPAVQPVARDERQRVDRKSTRLNSSHSQIS